jgi:hypothetical protein
LNSHESLINFRLFSHICAFHVFHILHSPCNVTFKVFTDSRWSDFLLHGLEKTCLEPQFIYIYIYIYFLSFSYFFMVMIWTCVKKINKQSNKKEKATTVGGSNKDKEYCIISNLTRHFFLQGNVWNKKKRLLCLCTPN